MDLIITTQLRENYGAHSWDGKGECPQYWKNKSGSQYIVTGVPEDVNQVALVALAGDHFGCTRSDDYYQEYIIGRDLEEEGVLSSDEKDQLEYVGAITHRTRRVDFQELVALTKSKD